ncbi:hypothetical protein [Reichenbachiella versicolor]|uniref:hypothetical protein n=1 Tax=Reichenbachiella versicolor TaxID=1821036 RepID=UPI000D6E1316|nr:hypothetical protein [Reichenbachiella versicolor]
MEEIIPISQGGIEEVMPLNFSVQYKEMYQPNDQYRLLLIVRNQDMKVLREQIVGYDQYTTVVPKGLNGGYNLYLQRWDDQDQSWENTEGQITRNRI